LAQRRTSAGALRLARERAEGEPAVHPLQAVSQAQYAGAMALGLPVDTIF